MYKTPSNRRSSYRNYGWTAFGIGGTSLGLIAAARFYELGTGSLGYLTITAAILVGIGLLACLLASYFPRDVTCFGHKVRIAKVSEIKSICAFAESVLGPVFPHIDDIMAMHVQNATIFHIIEATNTETELTEMTGCFSVIPLKTGAIDKVEAGGLTGFSLKPAHICKKNSGATRGLYLGTIIGIDKLSRACAIKELKEVIQTYARKSEITKLFARPITKDGLRIVKRHSFRHILTSGEPELNAVCTKVCKNKIS